MLKPLSGRQSFGRELRVMNQHIDTIKVENGRCSVPTFMGETTAMECVGSPTDRRSIRRYESSDRIESSPPQFITRLHPTQELGAKADMSRSGNNPTKSPRSWRSTRAVSNGE